ncbi:hypothetical protein UT300002_30700 [Clostridium perfringens]
MDNKNIMFKNLNYKKIICFFSFLIFLNFSIISCQDTKNNLNTNKKEWYFDYLNYNNLHKYATGEGQSIALIDSGISKFQDKLVDNKFSVIDENYYDTNGHGTIMASIIKGNNENLIGIAPNAKLISIKVLDSDGKIDPKYIKKALRTAIDNNVNIINMSIGSYKSNNDIIDLINEAIHKNIIVVSSSGDYADVNLMFPANINGVISVGAIDKNKQILKNSTAPNLTVINSPDKDILGVSLNNDLIYSSGTSQSTALITGYLALLLEASNKNNKTLSNDDIIKFLGLINKNDSSYLDLLKSIGS